MLNEVERELVLRMGANNFNIYFTHTGQILRMMYAGALDLSPSALASTAEALGLSKEELS